MRLFAALRALVAIWCLIGLDPAWAGTPGQDTLLFGRPGWVLSGAADDLNFATGQYFGVSPSQITVSRASSESEVCNGALTTFPPNALAVTPGCGLWVWEARTNVETNNSLAGSTIPCASSCATPTGWNLGSLAGLTITLASTQYINNMPTATINFQGSTSGGNFFPVFGTGSTATTYGMTWTTSAYLAQSGPSCSAINGIILVANFDTGNIASTNLSGTLTASLQYVKVSGTAASSSVTNITQAFLNIGLNAGAVNCSITVGLPDLELNPNLPASVASAVKAADGTGGVNGAGVYTVTGGTCTTPPTLNVTWAAGVLTIGAVVNAGSCSVLPPSPATLAYSSGAATGWTGATATLTPTDNSAQGFATGPILTSSGAVTRAGSGISLAKPISGPVSAYITATPYAPSAYPLNQIAVSIDDNSASNQDVLLRNAVAGGFAGQSAIGGSTIFNNDLPWVQGSTGKYVGYWSNNNMSTKANSNTTINVATPGLAVGLNKVHIGSYLGTGAAAYNGSISRIAIAPQSLIGK